MKIRPVAAEFYEDRRTDGQTDIQTYMTMPIVAFRNFANASKTLRSAHTAVFMRFVWISEQTVIISLYSIN